MPAIMKGWVDRVFTKGFAYGIRDPEHPGRTFRYGHGPLSGRRTQVLITTGSPAGAMGPLGINGPVDDVLFHLLHGTLWYVGMDALEVVEPLPYRSQNAGDYDGDLVLRATLAPGEQGLGVHLRR